MSKSLISDEKICIICGSTSNIHKHHIIHGYGKRKLADEQGCWCYLCDKHHDMSNEGVHFNIPFDTVLKMYCQEKWEQKNGDRTKFIQTFGKSYI